MSTSKTYQQSLADAGSENRPPMLERGSYIPWTSRFRRYLNRKRDNRKWLLKALDEGPYEFKNFVPGGSNYHRLQNCRDLKGMTYWFMMLKWRQTSSYYVTHPTSVVDYDDEYQQDDVHNNSEDPLVSAMLLLAKAITQNFSNPTNNRLRASSNTRNQAIIQGDRVNIQSRILGQYSIVPNVTSTASGKGIMLGIIQSQGRKTARSAFHELKNIELFIHRVQTQNTHLTSQLEMYKERVRILENINKDNNYLNEFLEADERAKRYNKQAQSQLVRDRDIIRDLEKQRDKLDLDVKNYKRKNEELQKTHSILKRQMSEKEDTYHDTILDLEAKLKKNVDLILKLGNSLQGMFMLGPKPLSVYDQQLKHGLGYPNPYTLKQAISKCPKLYVASSLGNLEIPLNVRDSEDTLEDAFKSQQKMTEKMNDPILEKLENENVSLDFKVQSLIKERDNVKIEYQKLFDLIKKTKSQTQKEMIELIVHVAEKTYAYGAIRAENQDLLSTISELKTRLEKVEKGVNATSRVRRPMSKDSSVTNSVLVNSKKAAKNVSVYVRKNKQKDNTSANVISNKENIIDVDVANASKAKTLLCVSCMQNVLIPCHDKCLAKHKLNVRSHVRRTFSTNSRIPKSLETTYVAPKTRFSEKETQSKTLDTTYVVSKSKSVESASKAKDKVVQIVLWVVDSGCSKHMTGDRSLLRNFIKKFIGTVRFRNDNFATIHDNITICHVYYVEGLGHNLFSVGQFCDGDLEVAFRSNTCYVRNLEGDDLLTRERDSNLYTISISDMAASSSVCLMSKATSTKSWLWHRRLSHLNFGTINDLTRLDLVDGLPKFKYGKDHLCSACERGKGKKASHPPKLVPSDHLKLELLHMDLCGPMRVASVNGKKYILVIVDDFSRFTWVYFLRSKDETPEIIKKFIAQAQLNYKAKVCKIRTDNGTEFKNATLKAYYEKLGIMQQFSIARTPQQNRVVERRNRSLVEAARTMLIFTRLPEFLWAEVVTTTCFTQNLSIINTRYNKTPYELLRGRKPNIEYFHVFGSLCYPTNDRDDLGKMKPKADIGVFIGYSETSKGFRIYNRRTKRIMETIHVKFDELTAMAPEHDYLELEL
ncbi:retrovirus-related pol polyprotein from transposon TNT 1-94 [Tanacetum coccineum]